MTDDLVGRFLAGIGALVWDESRELYLILRRAKDKDFAPGVWECVTGRLDQGEGFEEALYREVQEEIGIAVKPLFILGTTHFYRGESQPENELVGIVYLCRKVGKSSIRLSQEHSEYRWVTADEANELLGREHPTEIWLSRVVERAEKIRHIISDQGFSAAGYEGSDLDN